jgi:hypothetical protein
MLQQPNSPACIRTADINEEGELTDWRQATHSSLPKVDNDAGGSGFEVILEGGMERYKCSHAGCDKVYKRRCRVQEHIDLQHNPDGVVRFGCSEEGCLKSYCRLDALKSHQKQENHKGVSRIYRQIKEKAYSQRLKQAVFLITYASFDPIDFPLDPPLSPAESSPAAPLSPAKDSPKAIKDPSSHKVIKVSSATNIRYKCCISECGKSYATRFRCEVHMEAKHTEGYEKPFTCSFPGCSKAYSTKDSLTRHKRGVTHFVEGEADKRMEGEDPMMQPKIEEVSREKRDKMQELVELFDEI